MANGKYAYVVMASDVSTGETWIESVWLSERKADKHIELLDRKQKDKNLVDEGIIYTLYANKISTEL